MRKITIIENVTEFNLQSKIEEFEKQGYKITGYEWHLKPKGELKITYVDNRANDK